MSDYYTEEGVESGVSGDAFEQDPVLQEYQNEDEHKKWIDQLDASRKERKDFDKRAKFAIQRYADDRDEASRQRSRYNLFSANTDMKLAALYAQDPKPDVSRRFDDANDDVARVAAYLLERNISYELDSEDFGQNFKQSMFDWKVPGFGVSWLRFEQEGGEPTVQVQADPLTGAPVQVPGTSPITYQCSPVDYVAWDDFSWSPCSVWTQCRWVARRVPMTKEDVEQRFADTAPPEVLANLTFEKQTNSGADMLNKMKPQFTTEKTVDVHEIWDKERKLTFWIAADATVPLDVQADVCEFDGFFPTPLPPLGRFTTSNTLPISDFKLVQDKYRELDNLTNRIAAMVQAMKLNYMFDSSNKDLKDLFASDDELRGFPVDNWSQFQTEKGGYAGSVQFTDQQMESVINSYKAAIASRDAIKADIYEIEGISDIMRAASQPYDTAAATAAKATFGSSRLSMDQRQVADYIARVLRLKAHLICKLYAPQIIIQRAGVIPDGDQQLVQPAIEMLKTDHMACLRLNVSTDSIELPNWNQKTVEKTAIVQAVATMAQQVLPVADQHPEYIPIVAQFAKFLVAGMKGSGEIEGALDKAIAAIEQATAAKAQQPKPPTPEQIKAQQHQADQQTSLQIAQIKSDTAQQIAAIQAEAKKQVAAAQAQVDQIKTDTNARLQQVELQIKAFNAQTNATRAAHENAIDVVSLGAA